MTFDERPGTWMIHCHILDHAEGGLMGTVHVGPGPATEHTHPVPKKPSLISLVMCGITCSRVRPRRRSRRARLEPSAGPPPAGVTLADFAAKPVDREALIASLGLEFTAAERALVFPVLDGVHAQGDALDKIPDPALPVKYPRERGSRPADADNTLGAWYWRSTVKGAAAGALAGTTVALKDNIFLAGVPLMNGSSVFEGFVPDEDATVATRVLDAGGEILGKAVCENLCLTFSSHTAATGPVRNPHDPTRVTGGSSSGCAALVASKAVDLAVGGDQGGSIRVPAAFCGIVGHKPSWGLVPYTGAVPLDYSIDHLGPMARTVRECARLPGSTRRP